MNFKVRLGYPGLHATVSIKQAFTGAALGKGGGVG